MSVRAGDTNGTTTNRPRSVSPKRIHSQAVRVTGLWFWSCDADRDTCGDTEEDEYTFIGAPIIDGFTQRGRELKDIMREEFIGFSSIENILA